MKLHENPSLRELFSARGYPTDETLSARLIDGTPLEQAIWQEAARFVQTESSLRDKIAYVQRQTADALRYMDAGQSVNSLGILQSSALDVDRLCGQRASQIETLSTLIGHARREAEQAATA